MAFVYDQQEILREIIQQAERTFARVTAVEVARIVLYTGTITQLTDHFQVIRDPLIQAFGFVWFADLFQKIDLCAQIHIDFPHCPIHLLLSRHEEIGRIYLQLRQQAVFPSRSRIEGTQPLDLSIPKLHPVCHAVITFYGGEYVHAVAFDTEVAALELYFIVRVVALYQQADKMIPVCPLSRVQADHLFGKSFRIGHTVETRYGADHKHIFPP